MFSSGIRKESRGNLFKQAILGPSQGFAIKKEHDGTTGVIEKLQTEQPCNAY